LAIGQERGAWRGRGRRHNFPLTLANHREFSLFLLFAQEIQRRLVFFTLPPLQLSPPRTTPASRKQRIVGVAKELEFLHGCGPLAAGKFVLRNKDQFCTTTTCI